MITLTRIQELPGVPAVYALYGGPEGGRYVAYAGAARNLRRRIEQHLILRNSSVVAGNSPVALRPEYVSEVRWWEHPDFAYRDVLEGAELVAFEVLQPALRSRGAVRRRAAELLEDEGFRQRMVGLFEGEPAGRVVLPALEDVVARLEALERRVAELEAGRG